MRTSSLSPIYILVLALTSLSLGAPIGSIAEGAHKRRSLSAGGAAGSGNQRQPGLTGSTNRRKIRPKQPPQQPQGQTVGPSSSSTVQGTIGRLFSRPFNRKGPGDKETQGTVAQPPFSPRPIPAGQPAYIFNDCNFRTALRDGVGPYFSKPWAEQQVILTHAQNTVGARRNCPAVAKCNNNGEVVPRGWSDDGLLQYCLMWCICQTNWTGLYAPGART